MSQAMKAIVARSWAGMVAVDIITSLSTAQTRLHRGHNAARTSTRQMARWRLHDAEV